MSENFSKVPLSLASSMQRSLISGEYSDVRFTVGRHLGPVKCFPVHKYVLCLRSPVFGAMFYGKLVEKCDKAIDIPDVVPDAFANMLSFLYTDTVKNLRVDNVIPTLMCADKYDLPQLQKLCCDFVSAQLSADNCLVMLENAIHFHVDAIVERCLECIDRFADDVLQLDYFAVLDQKIIVLMLQRNTLIADENNVYLAAERWAAEACKANNMDPSAANRRQVLGEALFLVRFPLLTHTELADGPIKSGLLLASEVQDLYQYKFATEKPQLPFSVEPRSDSFRMGDVVFRYKELVFVHYSKKPNEWYPAEILSAEPGGFLYRWHSCEVRGTGTAASGKVVRASDMMKPGQTLWVKFENTFKPTIYCKADGDQHIVKRENREITVGLDRLSLDGIDLPHDKRLTF